MFEKAELSFKRNFDSISFCSAKPKSLEKQLLLNIKCHMRGSEKSHVLFEWPLTLLITQLCSFKQIMIIKLFILYFIANIRFRVDSYKSYYYSRGHLM